MKWRAFRRGVEGNALIEVMLAVSLMAGTALGLIAAQLWTAREARASATRVQAVLLADALTEAARSPGAIDAASARWRSLAATLLPQGDASVRDLGGGASVVQVLWTAQSKAPKAPMRGDVVDMPESCGGIVAPAGMHCVVMAFAR
ncbi:type IV pilus modification PilV family protein [Paraburkholderia sp.]|uniref:type IV pilus modification PilV family protein n=1 Tax=Paraburkholderia sp. TaxID=1926495 RepID=UPI003D6E34AE